MMGYDDIFKSISEKIVEYDPEVDAIILLMDREAFSSIKHVVVFTKRPKDYLGYISAVEKVPNKPFAVNIIVQQSLRPPTIELGRIFTGKYHLLFGDGNLVERTLRLTGFTFKHVEEKLKALKNRPKELKDIVDAITRDTEIRLFYKALAEAVWMASIALLVKKAWKFGNVSENLPPELREEYEQLISDFYDEAYVKGNYPRAEDKKGMKKLLEKAWKRAKNYVKKVKKLSKKL